MKTKRGIYFMMIVIGAAIMAVGANWMQKEYALSIGIVLLMLGIYGSTRVWNIRETGDNEEDSQAAEDQSRKQ